MRKVMPAILVSLILFSGCSTSGQTYDDGFLKNESSFIGPIHLVRDETHVSYNLFYDNAMCCGSNFAGVQYTNYLFGAIMMENLPGLAWALYPFQYTDVKLANSEAGPFGAGSGYFDIRISLLWGFISLGRKWNVLWINGFWHPKNDPLFFEKLDRESEKETTTD